MRQYVELSPSRYFFCWIVISCLALALSLFSFHFDSTLQNLAIIAVILSSVYVCFRDVKLSLPKSCIAFTIETANAVNIIQRNGQNLTGVISAGSLVTPFLIILNVALSENGSRNIVLLPDSMESNSFRQLRVLLRTCE